MTSVRARSGRAYGSQRSQQRTLRLAVACATGALVACAPPARRDAGVIEEQAAPSDDARVDTAASDVLDVSMALDAAEASTASLDAPESMPPLDVPTVDALDATLDGPAPLDVLDAAAAPEVSPDGPGDGGADGPLVDALYASSCTMPVRSLVSGDEVVGRATGPSRELGARCAPETPGPEDYYTFYNGSFARWFFSTDDPRTEADTVISVRSACADPAAEERCGDNGGVRTGTTTLTFAEFTRRGYALIVDRRDGTGPFTYVLRARSVPLVNHYRCLPPNSRILAPDGASVSGENLETGNSGGAPCDPSADTPQLFYRVTVPPGTQTLVTATPTAPLPTTWRPRVRAGIGCDVDCTEMNTAHVPGEPAVGRLANSSTEARTFWVSVGSDSTDVFGTYRVTTRSMPVQAGESCDLPEVLDFATPARGVPLSDALSNGFGCGVMNAGGSRYYSLTVPAGLRARVRATPAAGERFTPLLRRIEGCPSYRCREASQGSAAGEGAELTLTNPGSAPRVYTLALSSLEGGTHAVDLTAEQLPGAFPYVERTVPTRCDTLATSEAPLLGSPADDVTSPVSPLPFAFDYFGRRSTHFAVSSNGFLQLFDSASATAVASPTTRALPDPMAPRGLIAPYWTDLAARFPGGELRTGVLTDGGERRFVANWGSYQLRSNPTSLLNFQLKLYESSQAIELHFCSLTLGGLANAGPIRGGYSTTGLQDAEGIEGITYARNLESSLDPLQAIRYEPRR